MIAGKTKKKNPGIRIFIMLLLIAIDIYALLKFVIAPEAGQISAQKCDYQVQSNPSARIPQGPSSLASYGGLRSPNAILVRLNDRAIVMKQNGEEKIYPASLTKIMTVIIAIENLRDLNAEIKLSDSMFLELYDADASMAGFLPGERVSGIDLIYGAMLPSGAESCIALADKIAGSEQSFVKLMNKKAAGLGMKDSHFANTTGLHDKGHYSTVQDLAILLCYALKNDTFRTVFTTARHSIWSTNRHPDGITLFSKMFTELDGRDITNGEILGGKTGYTEEAGLCLASLARVDKQEYILVTAGAKGDSHTEQYNINDALKAYGSISEK